MAGLPSIAPFTQLDQSSSSSPAAHGGVGEGSSGGGSYSSGQRRRRTPSHVSLMACSECRHARVKCDGARPGPCRRCRSRNVNCVYEPHIKMHKDDLVREIEDLRGANAGLQDQNEDLLEAATSLTHENEGLQETSDWQKVILDTIGSNGQDRDIINKLRSGESYQSIADWLRQTHPISRNLSIVPASEQSLVDVVKRVEKHYHADEPRRTSSPIVSKTRWTNVSASPNLIEHLFDLYFTWVHPVHLLFNEIDFKTSFQSNDASCCSSPLVNAVCAMACHLLDNEGVDVSRRNVDAMALREAFMVEARSGLSPQSYTLLTSIQTFAIMYLVDLSSGKARRAAGYLRSAVEYMRAVDGDRKHAEAIEVSMWGVESINTFWAGVTYQKPFALELPHTGVFEFVRKDPDEEVWRFYRRIGDDHDLPDRQSFAMLTACNQAKLFRIVHESISLFCGARGLINAQIFLECYKRYVDWKDNLPPDIKNVDVSAQPLPHILFLHIQYHTALIHYLNPLAHCGYFSESSQDELRRMIVFHARSGIELVEHSRRLYSARFAMPLMAFCTIHLCDTLLRYSKDEPPASKVAYFCLSILQEARAGFAICGPLQELFCRTVKEFGVPLPDNIDELMGAGARYGMDDILDAYTRLSYTPPYNQIVRYLHPSIADQWPDEWRKMISARPSRTESSSGKYLQISSLLNS